MMISQSPRLQLKQVTGFHLHSTDHKKMEKLTQVLFM